MPFEKRTLLAGSENVQRPGLEQTATPVPDETLRVSVVLKRRADLPVISMESGAGRFLSHSQFHPTYGANDADINKVVDFADTAGLTVIEKDAGKRRVVLSGTARKLEAAFGAKLVQYRAMNSGSEYRGRTGTLSIPIELRDIVLAVLGFDARPVAKPHCRVQGGTSGAIKPRQDTSGSFTPLQIASLYNFPANLAGKGQTIAIIELGGGYRTEDLATYFNNLNVPAPKVTAVSVDGGQNTPGSDADSEVMLDIEVAGAIAHDANIAVYFAPNTDSGFINAITNAVHDTTRKPSVISISWGATEDSWSEQSRNAMNAALQDAAALGVTVTAAAGDNGSTDGGGDGKLHVDFPASSPFALACGGTTLRASGNQITSETVWNETANNAGSTGGGISNAFAIPAYQQAADVPRQPQTNYAGRGVPDVAGNADPVTGYRVRVNGQNVVIGGTSAVSPLWAALVAQINGQLGRPVGFLNPKLYSANTAFKDVSAGDNDDSNLGYYKARAGWDACTGLGTPDGTALLATLTSGASNRTEVTGSQLQHNSGSRWTDLADAESRNITVTVIVRRHGEDIGDDLLRGAEPALHHGNASSAVAASPEDIHEVESFAKTHGLTVIDTNATSRTVRVKGSAQQIAAAFGVQLGLISVESGEHITYKGAISVPDRLGNKVVAVLGLDQRPIARHHQHSA